MLSMLISPFVRNKVPKAHCTFQTWLLLASFLTILYYHPVFVLPTELKTVVYSAPQPSTKSQMYPKALKFLSLVAASQFNPLSCCRYFSQSFFMGLEPSPAALRCNTAAACTEKTNVLCSIPIWSPYKFEYAVAVGMIKKDYKRRSP